MGSTISSTRTTRLSYHMPGQGLYIEPDRHGQPQFVFRRSNSHSHHRGNERANITRDELDNMKENDRKLRRKNEELKTANANLKSTLYTVTQDLDRQTILAANYHRDAEILAAENRQLQNSLSNIRRGAERQEQDMQSLRLKYTTAKDAVKEHKEEGERLRARIRELGRQLRDSVREAVDQQVRRLRQEVSDWRERFERESDDFERARLANAQWRVDYERLSEENRRLKEENFLLRDDLKGRRRSWIR